MLCTKCGDTTPPLTSVEYMLLCATCLKQYDDLQAKGLHSLFRYMERYPTWETPKVTRSFVGGSLVVIHPETGETLTLPLQGGTITTEDHV